MEMLTETAIKGMCAYSFHTIVCVLSESKSVNYPSEFLQISAPLFVTWKINNLKYSEPILRGCIGTFSSAPFQTLLSKYAIISAFKDTRFPPIGAHELEHLHCTVSVLCNFETITDPYDWIVGKHGVEIQFSYKGIPYSGTYLPEVAEEQKWTQKVALDKLLEKAGFSKPLSKVEKMTIKRYQSRKATLSYNEYVEYLKLHGGLFHEKEDIKLKFYNDDDY